MMKFYNMWPRRPEYQNVSLHDYDFLYYEWHNWVAYRMSGVLITPYELETLVCAAACEMGCSIGECYDSGKENKVTFAHFSTTPAAPQANSLRVVVDAETRTICVVMPNRNIYYCDAQGYNALREAVFCGDAPHAKNIIKDAMLAAGVMEARDGN